MKGTAEASEPRELEPSEYILYNDPIGVTCFLPPPRRRERRRFNRAPKRVEDELDSLPIADAPPRPEVKPKTKTSLYPDWKRCLLHGIWYCYSCYSCNQEPIVHPTVIGTWPLQ